MYIEGDHLKPRSTQASIHEVIQEMLTTVKSHGIPSREILEKALLYPDPDAQYSRGTATGHVILTALQDGIFRSDRDIGSKEDTTWVSTVRSHLGVKFPYVDETGKEIDGWHLMYDRLKELDPEFSLDRKSNEIYHNYPSLFENVLIGFQGISDEAITYGADRPWRLVRASITNLTEESIKMIQSICGVDVLSLHLQAMNSSRTSTN